MTFIAFVGFLSVCAIAVGVVAIVKPGILDDQNCNCINAETSSNNGGTTSSNGGTTSNNGGTTNNGGTSNTGNGGTSSNNGGTMQTVSPVRSKPEAYTADGKRIWTIGTGNDWGAHEWM